MQRKNKKYQISLNKQRNQKNNYNNWSQKKFNNINNLWK